MWAIWGEKKHTQIHRFLCVSLYCYGGALRTQEGFLLLASPVDGADLPRGSPDTEPAGDQDAAVEDGAHVSPR